MVGPFLQRFCAIVLATGLIGAQSALAADITIALGAEPTTLDPQLADDGSERAVNDNIARLNAVLYGPQDFAIVARR